MTSQEYYEKYFLIDGKPPPPLTDSQKEFLKLYDSVKDNPDIGGIKVFQGRRRGYLILFKSIEAKLEFEGNKVIPLKTT